MSHTYNTIADTEVSGVFCQEKYKACSYRHNVPNSAVWREGIVGDYHLFAKHGDKVYIEAKKVGDIVMSFADLQKNRYLKYYYQLSLLLANDTHKVIEHEEFNKEYDEIFEYTGDRKWSLDTAHIDLHISQDFKKTYKVIPSGIVCYYKINPCNVKNMAYSTTQEVQTFLQIYMYRNDVRLGYFLNRSVIYENIALEYEVAKMDKEIEELKAYFEDKKQVVDMLSTITDKYANANQDILREIIVKYLS